MSRDITEFRQIRQEKATLEKLIRSYQKRNEELKEKEANILRRMDIMESTLFNWREIAQYPEKCDEYSVCDSICDQNDLRGAKICNIRAAVLDKQFENMKLQRELERKRQEHQKFHEKLARRKAGESSSSEIYLDIPTTSDPRNTPFVLGPSEMQKKASDLEEKNLEDELELWERLNHKL